MKNFLTSTLPCAVKAFCVSLFVAPMVFIVVLTESYQHFKGK